MGNIAHSLEHVDLPLAQRREHRVNARKPPSRFGFEHVSTKHDIANFMPYCHVSHAYRTFIASLQIVSVGEEILRPDGGTHPP
jgi:hypothetical protein